MWLIPGIVCVNRQKMTPPVVFFNLATPVAGLAQHCALRNRASLHTNFNPIMSDDLDATPSALLNRQVTWITKLQNVTRDAV